jgi:hypothetical protein
VVPSRSARSVYVRLSIPIAVGSNSVRCEATR